MGISAAVPIAADLFGGAAATGLVDAGVATMASGLGAAGVDAALATGAGIAAGGGITTDALGGIVDTVGAGGAGTVGTVAADTGTTLAGATGTATGAGTSGAVDYGIANVGGQSVAPTGFLSGAAPTAADTATAMSTLGSSGIVGDATTTAASGLTGGQILQGAQGALSAATGLNALMGGGLFGGLTAQQAMNKADPYGPYRGQAAAELQGLLQNPSQVLSMPGYQQTLNAGIEASQRGAAKTGQLQSGAEQAALMGIGQQNFGSYYDKLLGNLMTMSGANQNVAQATQAGLQASMLSQAQQAAGAQAALSGASSLYNIYNA